MSKTHEEIVVKRHGNIAILTIANPPTNRWTSESFLLLKKLIRLMNENPRVHSLIVTGEGQKYFSTGIDPKIYLGRDPRIAHDVARVSGEAFEALFEFKGPSIAVINGYALDSGLECALACDIRIAEDHARMGFSNEESLVAAPGTSVPWLSWIVGEAWAQHMGLCDVRMYARTALRLGLVEQVVPRGQGLTAAIKLAQTFEDRGLIDVRTYKSLVKDARIAGTRRGMDETGQVA